MIDIREMRVLIVDDMPSMCKFVHKMMRNLGYGREFSFANSGREAFNILKKEPVDLVMLDYNMPEMTGGQLLGMIRADRVLRDLSVIMVTAEQSMDYVAEIGEAEVDAYIIKPITMQLLDEKIRFVIDKANNPPPMIYHLKLARDFEEQGDLDMAIEQAKIAVEANPNATRPIRETGYYYYMKQDFKEAENWLLKAADMNKLDVFAFHHLGEIYLKKKDVEKAAYYLEKAMKISPRHLERGINFGKTLVRMKMVSKAKQVFEKTLNLAERRSELREEIAEFCIEENVNEYASGLLESIVQEQPDRADLLFQLGKTQEKLGNPKSAVTYLVRAGNLDKKNVDIKIHLAKDYLTLNKPMLAEGPLKEILKNNPDNDLARELLKQCV